MLEFLWKYLIGPIVAEARGGEAVWNGIQAVAGYNIYNTLSWAILGVAAVFLIIRIFEKFEVELDETKALNLVPLIILAGVLRFVQDAVNLPLIVEVLLITPVIYIWMAAIAVALLIFHTYRDFHFYYINAPIALAAITIILAVGVPPLPVTGIFMTSGVLAAIYYYVTEDTSYQSYALTLAVMSQFFEAFSSIYGLSRGYEPRQLLTSTVVEVMGPAGFLIVKLLILGLALKIFFDLEDRWRFILVVALYSIGFATGIRVVLRASLGV